MGRFFADEDFDAEIGKALAQLGHDLDGVVSRRHFVRLHRAAPSHAGIVVCSQRGQPEEMAGTIDCLLRELGSFAGRLVRVNLGDQTVE